jgi:hypothetical protein
LFADLRRVRDVAGVRRGIAAGTNNSLAGFCRLLFAYIQNANLRPVSGELNGNGLSNAAAAAGNYSDLVIESEVLGRTARSRQSETPRFQGMKSSCALNSAFV